MRILSLPLLLVLLIACNLSPNKKEAPTAKPVQLDRPLYKMSYAGDWSVDSSDKDFDWDSYFTLDTRSGSGFISVFVFNTGIDAKDAVDQQIKAHLEKTMKDGKVTHFDKWGSYKGEGANIQGKLMGSFKGNINIFSYSTDSTGFIAVYQLMDSEAEKDKPGVDLIKASFHLK